jgi:hypothetical protein
MRDIFRKFEKEWMLSLFHKKKESLYMSEVANEANSILERRGEMFAITARSVGCKLLGTGMRLFESIVVLCLGSANEIAVTLHASRGLPPAEAWILIFEYSDPSDRHLRA